MKRVGSRLSYGIYFLANDKVLDLCIAFLNSFRAHNPREELCLIPYDDSTEALLRLREQYNFRVFADSAALSGCDRLSELVFGRRVGEFRKLAMWEGPFERFAYFDVDTVVLERASFARRMLSLVDLVLAQSHIPENVKCVWKERALSSGLLSPSQIAYAGQTGFIASRKGVLSVASALARADEITRIAPYMATGHAEQPTLNFLAVTSGYRCSSLAHFAALNPDLDIPLERWAGSKIRYLGDGRIASTRRRYLFVHWAGLWQQGAHRNSALWLHYRGLNI